MNVRPFDPYAAESRLLWHNRVAAWRANASESAFSGLAWCAALALFAGVAIGQLPSLRAAAVWLHTHFAWTLLCGLAALLLIDHARMRRRQRKQWATDWLCAQPIAPTIRARRRLRSLTLRVASQSVLIAALLGFSGMPAMGWLVAAISVIAAACVGNWLGDIDRSFIARPRRRETVFTSTASGSVPRWQWIEAGASLAPRHLAPLLLVILLIPRGPAVMALAAVLLLVIASGISAWLRAVHVMIAAERWLAVEPIPARAWLAQCIRIPLVSLFIGALIAAGLLTPAANASLALIVSLGLLMLGTLYVAVVASGRAQPARIALHMTVHLALLVAVSQALALLLPAVFAAQIFVLTKRSLR